MQYLRSSYTFIHMGKSSCHSSFPPSGHGDPQRKPLGLLLGFQSSTSKQHDEPTQLDTPSTTYQFGLPPI